MGSLFDALLIGVILLNLFALGTSRIRALIHAAAAQGVVLGILSQMVHEHVAVRTLLVAGATILLKGMLLPKMLLKALRDAQIKREVEPLIGFMPSILLGAVGTAAAIALADRLPLAPGQAHTLIVPAAFSTLFTGFILLTTRIKAITQVIGYLLLENGVFVFGLLLFEAMPLLVELGVLLDLFVAVFVASIILHHINREFDSLDTRRLSALKE
jgi:hydrogenase-4 component E